MITVFTPTYNRAYIINKLYESLCRQDNKDFEWIIVDDGSTDNTEEVVTGFINQDKINIRFFRHQNGGKHRAINFAVKEAKGELFFIVDSDDHIYDNAIDIILNYYKDIKGNNEIAGLSFNRTYPDGSPIGLVSNFDIIDCSCLVFRYKYHIMGDQAEIYRTDILKQFPFPEIKGEKFCPEALVWNRIAQKYKLRFVKENICYSDYLEDGLTAKITQIRMQSPSASLIHYAELSSYDVPMRIKIRSYINFWRFAPCSNLKFREKTKMISGISLLFIPAAFLLHIKDNKR